MKALNVLLAIVVSLVIGVLVLEGGLRLLGRGPQKTLNQFDSAVGWSKTPGTVLRRKAREFDVTFKINELGLRGAPRSDPSKPTNVFRVLMLGDSFTLGYSVDSEDLFVQQLARWWRAENRRVDVINAGTEGYSTDQSVAWLLEHGADFDPDLVLLFPYDNDLYWNGQTEYVSAKRVLPKPRFTPQGELERRDLIDTTDTSWRATLALGSYFRTDPDRAAHMFTPGTREIEKEHGALLHKPPDFMKDAEQHTLGALRAFRRACAGLGATAVVVPIPSHSVVDVDHAAGFGAYLGLSDDRWNPNKPVDTVLRLATEAGLGTLDPRTTLKAASRGTQLYNSYDWHFNRTGNEIFASFLHDRLDSIGAFPATHSAPVGTPIDLPRAARTEEGAPFWLKLYAILWVVLTILYLGHYPDEPKWQPPLKVAAMLSAVFAIVFGANALVGLLPQRYAPAVMATFVLCILGFIAYKIGRRLGTIAELLKAFVLRGHWYLMPLIVVLLTIGSLLVVAASSPLVAPFIYTLF